MEIKDAVRNAIAFAVGTLGPERTADIRLEEVESSTVNASPVWLITLSSSTTPEGPVAASIRSAGLYRETPADREYKVFTVTKDTGEILSMKIRLLATPDN
jgi:hypothetical protein